MNLLQSKYPDYRFGYVGVSQGGPIAVLAAKLVDIDFVTIQSASATSLNEQLETEIGNDVMNFGIPEFLQGVA